MNYNTFQPSPDLSSLVQCFWMLEVPADPDAEKQRIVPDGCIEMGFMLGDDVRRFTSEHEFIIQPRAMVIGQLTEPFYVQPTGHMNFFAARFYPYGFANFVSTPIINLANKETPIDVLFGEAAIELEQQIIHAEDTQQRIEIMERFLLNRLNEKGTIDTIVKSTVDALLSSNGSSSINDILQDDLSKRRQLERKFRKQIGMSAKQLGKIIRMQTALKMLLNEQPESLSKVAYDSEYYDQAHFIKDFKEFTGTSPKDFLKDEQMLLSAVLYTKE
jgi:AraC-like DNA-binding protein